MLILVCAMPEESKLLISQLGFNKKNYYWERDNARLFVTGIGCQQVKEVLSRAEKDGLLTKNDDVLNFGYAGSNKSKVGNIHFVTTCRRHGYPNINGFILNKPPIWMPWWSEKSKITCYTSDEFVEHSNIIEPCLFDMELFEICRHANRQIYSLKIVSDNLNERDFDKNIQDKILGSYNGLIFIINRIIKANAERRCLCEGASNAL